MTQDTGGGDGKMGKVGWGWPDKGTACRGRQDRDGRTGTAGWGQRDGDSRTMKVGRGWGTGTAGREWQDEDRDSGTGTAGGGWRDRDHRMGMARRGWEQQILELSICVG